jgi:hypothetical protein
MCRRRRWFILIPTLLLIPLLVGMVPLKLVNKLTHGTCMQCQGTQASQRNCPAHSLISQNHVDVTAVNSASPDQELSSGQATLDAVAEFGYSNIHSAYVPLRC